MSSIKKPPIYQIPLVQLLVLIPLSLVVHVFNEVAAYSVFLGGVVCVLPNAYFALYAFRYSGARHAQAIATAFFWGETGKFALTVVGFGGIFLLVKPLNMIALFSAYGAMLIIQWAVSARLASRF